MELNSVRLQATFYSLVTEVEEIIPTLEFGFGFTKLVLLGAKWDDQEYVF